MNKKFFSVIILSLIIPFSFVSLGFSSCCVAVTNEAGIVLRDYYSSGDITKAFENALSYTRDNASKNNILTIKLLKGKYRVSSTLHLTSYTVVDLGGATLVNANKGRGNILKSPEDKPYPRYTSLNQCTVKNGTLDDNFNKNQSCILRLCHAQNILIENIKFKNNYFSHHFELAACRDVVVKNCEFTGQVSDLNISSSEAIQIDILDKIHFFGFTCYDNTMNDTITIDSCKFKNVYRGVGTHNYFKDMYQKNITVTNCIFQNINDCGISAVNFENIDFKNNAYINCKYSVFWRDNGK